MTLQLHRPDGEGGLEPVPPAEGDWRTQLQSPRWGTGLESGRLPDLKNPALYFNREWSWLGFNRRVLEEAMDPTQPLLERVKFLSIVDSNLTEFFEVRAARLQQQMDAGVSPPTPDHLSAREQWEGIAERAVTDEQKAEIAEVRRVYEARVAEAEILFKSKLAAVFDPEERAKLSENHRRDLQRLQDDRERKLARIRG